MNKITIENKTGEDVNVGMDVEYKDNGDAVVSIKKVSTGKPEPQAEIVIVEDTDGRRVTYDSTVKIPTTIEIVHDFKNHSVAYSVCHPGGNLTGSSQNNGKLTGVQLRTIHAVDQLQALLDDALYECIKELAAADDNRLIRLLHQCSDNVARAYAHEDDPKPDTILQAIKAMALFCYTEIVERGLDAQP